MGNALSTATDHPEPRAGWNPSVQAALDKGRRKVPKYLFRAWAKRSGGQEGLNTPERITPPAFASRKNGESGPYTSVYDSLTQQDFVRMALAHVHHQKYTTAFSSWTQSLNFALAYAFDLERDEQQLEDRGGAAHIAILDTDKLPNWIVHVPHVDECIAIDYGAYGDDLAEMREFDWEFLVHGVIDSISPLDSHPAFKAVPLADLVNQGLLTEFPAYSTPNEYTWDHAGELMDPSTVRALSTPELQRLSHLAAPFGPDFQVAVTVALVCLRRRSRSLWWGGWVRKSVLDAFCEGFEVAMFPDLRGCEAVMTDRVLLLEARFDDLAQMVRLFRALEGRRRVMMMRDVGGAGAGAGAGFPPS